MNDCDVAKKGKHGRCSMMGCLLQHFFCFSKNGLASTVKHRRPASVSFIAGKKRKFAPRQFGIKLKSCNLARKRTNHLNDQAKNKGFNHFWRFHIGHCLSGHCVIAAAKQCRTTGVAFRGHKNSYPGGARPPAGLREWRAGLFNNQRYELPFAL